ncbi:MerR family DNA-binding protein [Paenibacillus sp. MAHUQ-63]|nr:MerR family DNA-binding protein [Paenibacillus sp. MAHUQ-63]MDD9268571.1 MerR family DNA-binding protein [Paenibacillus sp. MAHUQ-63]
MYSNEAVEDIRFIKRAQDLGFTLDEIKTLLHVHKNED